MKSKNNKNNSAKDRLEVLLEDMQDKMGLVLEGHSALDIKFTKKFDNVERELKLHTLILQEHSKILHEHSGELGVLRRDLEILKNDSVIIKHY